MAKIKKTLRDELSMELTKESDRTDQFDRSLQTMSLEENMDGNK